MSNLQRLMQHVMQAQIIEAQIHSLEMARSHADANDADITALVADKKQMLKFETDAIKHIANSL